MDPGSAESYIWMGRMEDVSQIEKGVECIDGAPALADQSNVLDVEMLQKSWNRF